MDTFLLCMIYVSLIFMKCLSLLVWISGICTDKIYYLYREYYLMMVSYKHTGKYISLYFNNQ